MIEREFYSVNEVAEILNLNAATVRKQIKNKVIRSIRIGDTPKARYRILKKELDRYIAEEYEKRNYNFPIKHPTV